MGLMNELTAKLRRQRSGELAVEMEKDMVLSVKGLEVNYGPINALKDVTVDVKQGSIVCILGSNGAGKTTLLKKISGVVPADKGKIHYRGEDITALDPEVITRKGIVQSPEGRQVFADLTVKENLQIGAFTLKDDALPSSMVFKTDANPRVKSILESEDVPETIPMTREEIIRNNMERVYKMFPVLKERAAQIAGSLSGGEQQMLAIGRALMASPKLLILDEPSLGLAPMIVKDIFSTLQELNNQGTTILIVEQNALQTLKIADYGYVLKVGKIIKHADAQALLNDQELIDAYIGK